MNNYEKMSLAELEAELKRLTELKDDLNHEREFLGKQSGMHLGTGEFIKLDNEIEETEQQIEQVNQTLSKKG